MRAIEPSWSSSAVRSCITRCARCWSFQRLGSSAARLSSSRRLRALSKSKMPPQQPDRLLDLVDDRLNFRAHGLSDWLSSFCLSMIFSENRFPLFGIMLERLFSDPEGIHKAPSVAEGATTIVKEKP